MDIKEVYTIMRDPQSTVETKAKANEVINRPIPKELIKSREGANKMQLSYIEGETVIRLLNEAFGESGWTFQIVQKTIIQAEPKQMTRWNQDTRKSEKVFNPDGTPKLEPQAPIAEVHGRLIVPGFGVREQFGTKTLIGGSSEQEGASKAATTDALKKCATLFGIGLELYDDKDIAAGTSKPASNYGNSKPQYNKPYESLAPNKPAPSKPKAEEVPWPQEETKKLKELKELLKVSDNEKLNPYVQEFTGNKEATYEMITPVNIGSFNKFLEKKFF